MSQLLLFRALNSPPVRLDFPMDPDGTLHPANMARLIREQYLKTNKVRTFCSFLYTYTHGVPWNASRGGGAADHIVDTRGGIQTPQGLF
jgi:hypothetical protein